MSSVLVSLRPLHHVCLILIIARVDIKEKNVTDKQLRTELLSCMNVHFHGAAGDQINCWCSYLWILWVQQLSDRLETRPGPDTAGQGQEGASFNHLTLSWGVTLTEPDCGRTQTDGFGEFQLSLLCLVWVILRHVNEVLGFSCIFLFSNEKRIVPFLQFASLLTCWIKCQESSYASQSWNCRGAVTSRGIWDTIHVSDITSSLLLPRIMTLWHYGHILQNAPHNKTSR